MWEESLNTIFFKDKNKYNNIYNERFNSENAYHFNFNINGNKAFFFIHKDIIKILSDISFLDKKVDMLIKSLPKAAQNLYIRKSLIDEILYTNEIEGVISTRKEIGEIIDNLEKSNIVKPNKINSLINKYRMMIHEYHESVLNAAEIRKIYDELVLDEVLSFDKLDKPDGVLFRANAVEVKNEVSGRVMHEGVMPESKIIEYLSIAVNFLNDESIIPLIRIAAFHYIFSYIHPFYDGNGRTNRFISSMYLKKYYSSIIPYRLSLTIKKNKKQYYDAFDITNNSRNKGDISTFIYEFVDIVKKAYESTVDYLIIKKNELDEKIEQISKCNLSKKEREVLCYLNQRLIFKYSDAKISDICDFVNISNTTARKILNELYDKGLIKKGQELKYNTYIAI